MTEFSPGEGWSCCKFHDEGNFYFLDPSKSQPASTNTIVRCYATSPNAYHWDMPLTPWVSSWSNSGVPLSAPSCASFGAAADGTQGYLYNSQVSGTVAYFECHWKPGTRYDAFVSTDQSCEGTGGYPELLGYGPPPVAVNKVLYQDSKLGTGVVQLPQAIVANSSNAVLSALNSILGCSAGDTSLPCSDTINTSGSVSSGAVDALTAVTSFGPAISQMVNQWITQSGNDTALNESIIVNNGNGTYSPYTTATNFSGYWGALNANAAWSQVQGTCPTGASYAATLQTALGPSDQGYSWYYVGILYRDTFGSAHWIDGDTVPASAFVKNGPKVTGGTYIWNTVYTIPSGTYVGIYTQLWKWNGSQWVAIVQTPTVICQ